MARPPLRRSLPGLCCLALLAALLPPGPAAAEGTGGKRYAVLVGVNEYEHKAYLGPLNFTENDMEKLAALLASQAGGFHSVRVLTTARGRSRPADRPTGANVRAALRGVLRKCDRDDLVVVAYSGHGVQLHSGPGGREEAFFCMTDTRPGNVASHLAVREVFEAFEASRAGAKLLLVDACRNNPGKGGRGLDVDAVPRPAQGTAALFSCSSGETAFETGKLRHSVFFHFVLEGLRGQAKDRKGSVSWHNLVGYVTDQVSDEVPRIIRPGVKQTPHQVANLRGKSPVLVSPGRVLAAEGGKALRWELALELKARKVGEAGFSASTKVFGLEAYTDGRSGHAVYVSETGSIAALPGPLFKGKSGATRRAIPQHGMEVTVRPFGQGGDVNKGKNRFSLEAYKDDRNGHLVYLSHLGDVSVVPARYASDTAGRPRSREHLYGLDLKVRKHGQQVATKATRGFGVEVYRDRNNGNLIYITETGTLAVVPRSLAGAKRGAGAASLQGFDLAVRKAREQKITRATRRFGVEVFRDENNGNLIYVSEVGDLAVVPARLARAGGPSRSPSLQHAYDLTVRRAGETEVTAATRRVGVEAYLDEARGAWVYISETGALGVVPAQGP